MVNEAGLGDLTTEELAQRMWNGDETAFATDVASKRVFSRREEKSVHETGGGSGWEYITVLGCGSASGEHLLPMSYTKGWICGSPGLRGYHLVHISMYSIWVWLDGTATWFNACCIQHPAVVDKTELPSLLKRLWKESFEAKHLKAGFRKPGLQYAVTTEATS